MSFTKYAALATECILSVCVLHAFLFLLFFNSKKIFSSVFKRKKGSLFLRCICCRGCLCFLFIYSPLMSAASVFFLLASRTSCFVAKGHSNVLLFKHSLGATEALRNIMVSENMMTFLVIWL